MCLHFCGEQPLVFLPREKEGKIFLFINIVNQQFVDFVNLLLL